MAEKNRLGLFGRIAIAGALIGSFFGGESSSAGENFIPPPTRKPRTSKTKEIKEIKEKAESKKMEQWRKLYNVTPQAEVSESAVYIKLSDEDIHAAFKIRDILRQEKLPYDHLRISSYPETPFQAESPRRDARDIPMRTLDDVYDAYGENILQTMLTNALRQSTGEALKHLEDLPENASIQEALIEAGLDANKRRKKLYVARNYYLQDVHTLSLNIPLNSGSGKTPGLFLEPKNMREYNRKKRYMESDKTLCEWASDLRAAKKEFMEKYFNFSGTDAIRFFAEGAKVTVTPEMRKDLFTLAQASYQIEVRRQNHMDQADREIAKEGPQVLPQRAVKGYGNG